MTLSCRTGLLRGGRSLRDLCTGLGGFGCCGPRDARRWRDLTVAAEAVDEAAVAFGWTLCGRGCIPGHWA